MKDFWGGLICWDMLTCCLAFSDSSVQFFIVQSFCSLLVFFNFLGVHVLYVLCFYVLIVILYVLLCCHLRRNKDTYYKFNVGLYRIIIVNRLQENTVGRMWQLVFNLHGKCIHNAAQWHWRVKTLTRNARSWTAFWQSSFDGNIFKLLRSQIHAFRQTSVSASQVFG